jgi:hypothetical protein
MKAVIPLVPLLPAETAVNPVLGSVFRALACWLRRIPQVEGWKTLPLSSRVQTVASGDVKVAVRISVCWETQMTYYIDDVTTDIK